MEVEAKKMRREVAAMEKEVAAMRVEKDHENRAKRFGNTKGPVSSAQLLPGRYLTYQFIFSFCFSSNVFDYYCSNRIIVDKSFYLCRNVARSGLTRSTQ